MLHFDNRHSLKYEYNNKCKEQNKVLKGEYVMSTLELLQLQNEHNDNFFGKGEEILEKGEEIKQYYIIFDNMDKYGNGVSVCIDKGTLFVEFGDECGYAGGEWECDIESLKQHIAKYEQGLKGE